jgi:hypothetical protein
LSSGADVPARLSEVAAVRRALHGIEDAWCRQGAPITAHLAPGLTNREIDTILRPIGITLPEAAREVFRWHDGAGLGEPHPWFGRALGFGNWRFQPLQQCVDYYADEWLPAIEEAIELQGPGPDVWRPWFPLFLCDEYAQAVVIFCTETPLSSHEVCAGNVHAETPLTALRHLSLAAVLETWRWWLDAEHVRWDAPTGEWCQSDALHWTTYRAGFD